MRMKYFVMAAGGMFSFVVLLVAVGWSQHRTSERLALEVRETGDKTKEIIPGSRLYVGELSNKGGETLKLEAIQTSGEYQGTGQFFKCDLQVWKGKWLRLWSADDRSRLFVDIELKPGDHREVCTMLLPNDAGSVGQCVRFRVKTRWDRPSTTVLSQPFVIGDVPAKAGPCGAAE
jgi:hypothetical protein